MAEAQTARKRGLSQERLRQLYREMLLIRHFEEKVEEQFRAGELPGFLHVAIGQEAVAVGVASAMAEGDVFASTHRAHGHALARGSHPDALMAELYGKVEGVSRGYGGSMHLYDVERGNLGANAVVGGGLPMIAGAALAFHMRGEPRVAVAFFGDGATNIGTFHEALNLAQLWKLPALFVCEQNTTPRSTAHAPTAADHRSLQARCCVRDALDDGGRAGRGGGPRHPLGGRWRTHGRATNPALLLAKTHRLVGHDVGDPQVYRPKANCRSCASTGSAGQAPALRLGLSNDDLAVIDAEVVRMVEGSVEFARNATEHKPEDALENIYA